MERPIEPVYPIRPITLPFNWKQGEHMSIIGDTGTGKTTLAAFLLRTQPFVLTIITKGDRKKIVDGKVIKTAKQFQKIDIESTPHIILEPEPYLPVQQKEIYYALNHIWHEQGWCVYFDELFYLTDELKLTRVINRLLTQGRSKGITIVSGMQRPVGVTRWAISQASHNLSFLLEGRDVLNVKDTSPLWASQISILKRREFAWFYRPERTVWTGKLRGDRLLQTKPTVSVYK